MQLISKIISGGQTGADRAGLDAAIRAGIPHGGHCPRNRRCEYGVVPQCYRLLETQSSGYAERTERNVFNSHCTIVFTYGPASGGSAQTIAFASKIGRPCLHVDLNILSNAAAAWQIADWIFVDVGLSYAHLLAEPFPVVNIAGSRESKAPRITHRVMHILLTILKS